MKGAWTQWDNSEKLNGAFYNIFPSQGRVIEVDAAMTLLDSCREQAENINIKPNMKRRHLTNYYFMLLSMFLSSA